MKRPRQMGEQTEEQKDGQTLFHGTLPTNARGPKRLKKIEDEYFISFLGEVIYILPKIYNINFKVSTKVTSSLIECFKQKKSLSLLQTPFHQNQSKKPHKNHIRQLCIGKDWLVSVKYRLSPTKIKNIPFISQEYP